MKNKPVLIIFWFRYFNSIKNLNYNNIDINELLNLKEFIYNRYEIIFMVNQHQVCILSSLIYFLRK